MLLINFWFMWTCINMQKIKLFHWFVLENPEQILIKESCNLIGREHFGPYPSNKNFPKYLCRNTANNLNFHYRTNSVKSNDQNFQYIQKKPCFWPIFDLSSQFLGQKDFFQKIWLSCATSYWCLTPCQNL